MRTNFRIATSFLAIALSSLGMSEAHAQANANAGLAQGAAPAQSTALAPMDFNAQGISDQLASLDRRIGVQEDFMRRLAVALQASYSSR